MDIEVLIAIAGVLLLISYGFTNMLFQRLFTLLALSLLIWICFLVGYERIEVKTFIIFSTAAILINLYQIFHYIKDRIVRFLPKEMRQVRRCFPSMTNSEFLELYKISQIRKSKQSDILIIQDTLQINIFYITKGEVEIQKDGKHLAYVDADNFIGEVSYITGNYANASVIVSSLELEALEWNKKKLDKLRLKHPEVFNKFYQTLALNLVEKVSVHKTHIIHEVDSASTQ